MEKDRTASPQEEGKEEGISMYDLAGRLMGIRAMVWSVGNMLDQNRVEDAKRDIAQALVYVDEALDLARAEAGEG